MSTSTCLPAPGYLRWKLPRPSASFLKIPALAFEVRVIPFVLRKANTAYPVLLL